jgi:hypothetical protein
MKPEFQDIPDYLRLVAGGSRARLAILREKVAHVRATNKSPSMTPADWRAARAYGFHNWRAAHGAGLWQGETGEGCDKSAMWYSHAGEQFRGERFADECEGGPDHRGWFTQADGTTYKDGTGLARGIVARLPHGRFIAGYWSGDNGERVYLPEVFTEEREAARAADGHAESFADMAREDNEKWEAARELESETEDAEKRLRECLALRHRACTAYVREEARELIETIRGNRARLAGEFADYR